MLAFEAPFVKDEKSAKDVHDRHLNEESVSELQLCNIVEGNHGLPSFPNTIPFALRFGPAPTAPGTGKTEAVASFSLVSSAILSAVNLVVLDVLKYIRQLCNVDIKAVYSGRIRHLAGVSLSIVITQKLFSQDKI
jgi:hypothetical protein